MLVLGKYPNEAFRPASMIEGLNRPLKLSILVLLWFDVRDLVCGEDVSPLFTGELPVEPKVGACAFGLELETELRGRTPGRALPVLLFAQVEADGRVEDRDGLVP